MGNKQMAGATWYEMVKIFESIQELRGYPWRSESRRKSKWDKRKGR